MEPQNPERMGWLPDIKRFSVHGCLPCRQGSQFSVRAKFLILCGSAEEITLSFKKLVIVVKFDGLRNIHLLLFTGLSGEL